MLRCRPASRPRDFIASSFPPPIALRASAITWAAFVSSWGASVAVRLPTAAVIVTSAVNPAAAVLIRIGEILSIESVVPASRRTVVVRLKPDTTGPTMMAWREERMVKPAQRDC
jgi:hypothetical protein